MAACNSELSNKLAIMVNSAVSWYHSMKKLIWKGLVLALGMFTKIKLGYTFSLSL
jgi:hypothetical protein